MEFKKVKNIRYVFKSGINFFVRSSFNRKIRILLKSVFLRYFVSGRACLFRLFIEGGHFSPFPCRLFGKRNKRYNNSIHIITCHLFIDVKSVQTISLQPLWKTR